MYFDNLYTKSISEIINQLSVFVSNGNLKKKPTESIINEEKIKPKHYCSFIFRKLPQCLDVNRFCKKKKEEARTVLSFINKQTKV